MSQQPKAVQSTGPKRNPEIDKQIDAYIKANPDRIRYLKSESKDDLIRRVVVREVQQQAERQQRQLKESEAVKQFLQENPKIAETIEKRLQNVTADRREAARIQMGKREATRQALKI